MRAAVVEEGNTLEDGKNPAEVEVDKSLAEESKIPAGQVQQLGGAKKTRVSADAEDPPRDCGAKQTHLLDVVEEEDDFKKVQLQKKKAKKRKKSELEEIKKEKQYGDVETQVQQLGAVEKTQVSADAEDPSSNCGAEQTHLLDVVEEDDDSKNVQLQKKKVKKRKRRELEQIKEEVLVEAGVPLRWRASYYTLLLHRYETPRYKGSIVLYPLTIRCYSTDMWLQGSIENFILHLVCPGLYTTACFSGNSTILFSMQDSGTGYSEQIRETQDAADGQSCPPDTVNKLVNGDGRR